MRSLKDGISPHRAILPTPCAPPIRGVEKNLENSNGPTIADLEGQGRVQAHPSRAQRVQGSSARLRLLTRPNKEWEPRAIGRDAITQGLRRWENSLVFPHFSTFPVNPEEQ